MPTFTSHEPGTFAWVELMTTDQEGAKKFYSALLGWDCVDMPIGPNAVYTMAKIGGRDAAAIMKIHGDVAGMPPAWASYVAVEDVDATTKKAAAVGGKILRDAFDVMDVGRMSVVQDPAGAVIALWQAKKHIGVGVKNEPGALCWNELLSTNVDASGKFYVQTLGWQTRAEDMGPMGTYTLFQQAAKGKDGNIGGMLNMPPSMKGAPSHWLAYFLVADADASTKKAGELGGKVLMPPMDIPNIGRFSIVQDPQGAAFALYENAH